MTEDRAEDRAIMWRFDLVLVLLGLVWSQFGPMLGAVRGSICSVPSPIAPFLITLARVHAFSVRPTISEMYEGPKWPKLATKSGSKHVFDPPKWFHSIIRKTRVWAHPFHLFLVPQQLNFKGFRDI